MIAVAGPGGKCGKRFVLSKQLVEIIKKKLPKATESDFHSCGSFHRSFVFFWRSLYFSVGVGKDVAPGSSINDDRHHGRRPAWPIFHSFTSGGSN
jgi:hypothetical protein